MVKYLSGRVKRTPQDQLKDDRYKYLNLEQAEPNLSDPLAGPTPPPGGQYQLIAIPGYPGQRFWVPVGGGLIPGAITIFDEGVQVSTASSITQLNFVGAAVTANVSVQSPSGHPGIAATVTVIPVTVGNEPPTSAKNGELWWESDTGDLFVRYDDPDSSQWVMANAGGRGPEGQKGEKGDVEAQGNKGEKGIEGQKGEKGEKGEKGSLGDKGNDGEKGFGEKGIKGEKGEGTKGDKGDIGNQGAKAGLRYRFSSVTTNGDPGQGVFRFNNSSASNVNQIYIDILEINSVDVSDQLLSWDDSSSLVSGYLYVSSNDNSDNSLSIFEITSATNSTSYITIGVQNGFGNVPSDQEQCVLNFSRTGDKGQKGQEGDKGEIGEKGIEGLKGEKGEVGEKGIKGDKGDKGDKGNDGDLGVQGDKGEVGEKGDKGDKGDKGEEGQKGPSTNSAVDISITAPSGATTGDLWWDSDEGDLYVYYNDGNSSQWVAATSPAATKGEKGQDGTNAGKGEPGSDGSDGTSVKGEPGASTKGEPGSTLYAVPQGGIIIWSGASNTIPSGWVLCNGSNSTPDLRAKFVVGAGSGYSVNDTGGAASVTLTTAQMPSHNHSFSGSGSHSHNINNHTHSFSGSSSHNHGINDPGHTHTMNFNQGNIISSGGAFGLKDSGTANRINTNTTGISVNSQSVSISGNTGNPSNTGTNSQSVSISGNTGSNGSGNSHENRPPYYALCYIMKT